MTTCPAYCHLPLFASPQGRLNVGLQRFLAIHILCFKHNCIAIKASFASLLPHLWLEACAGLVPAAPVVANTIRKQEKDQTSRYIYSRQTPMGSFSCEYDCHKRRWNQKQISVDMYMYFWGRLIFFFRIQFNSDWSIHPACAEAAAHTMSKM